MIARDKVDDETSSCEWLQRHDGDAHPTIWILAGHGDVGNADAAAVPMMPGVSCHHQQQQVASSWSLRLRSWRCQHFQRRRRRRRRARVLSWRREWHARPNTICHDGRHRRYRCGGRVGMQTKLRRVLIVTC